MNWLITGGCGFIGIALVERLHQEGGHNIRILDDLTTGSREDLSRVVSFSEIAQDGILNMPAGVDLIVGDILDEQLALSITQGFDIIIHLAANTGVGPSVDDPRADCMKNVIGTFNYLEASRHNDIPRFIFASSGAPAGEVEPPIHEELPPHPVSPYGASKLAGEGYCSAYFRTFGIETVVLRFGNVYGPGSIHKSSIVAKFINRALQGQVLEIYGDGSQTRDFIYIDDLIDAIILAANTPNIGGEVFQIASSQEMSVIELSQQLVRVLSNVGVEDMKLVNTETRLGDVRRSYSDTTKANQLLGWSSNVSLDEGLKKTVKYFFELTG